MTRRETENDKRIAMFNAFLTTPHGDMKAYHGLHKESFEADPEFYARLAVWYYKSGKVQDHKNLFTAMLLHSTIEGHRDAALNFLRSVPPDDVEKIVDFSFKNISKSHPRCLRTELNYYMWERENNRNQMDRAILYFRKYMRKLVRLFRIPRSEYVQKVLIEDDPPAGSLHHTLKQISAMTDPLEQTKLLLANRIPFQIATSVLKKFTPSAWVALIEGMSPQDVINHMGMLQKKGVLDNADIKTLVEKKLDQAKTNKNVSALKVKDAKKAAPLSADMSARLDAVADTQLKAQGRITRHTGLFVDTSGSLIQAIEVSKQLGAVIGAVMGDDTRLEVIGFDSMPRQIDVKGRTFADFEKAFATVKVGGSTACGAPFAWLIKKNILVEQVIVVTDELENASPTFTAEYENYAKALNIRPQVVIVRLGKDTVLSARCKAANIPVDVYEIGSRADKYSFTNLIPMLTRKSTLDLLMDIMSEDLPKRLAPIPKPRAVREAQAALAAR